MRRCNIIVFIAILGLVFSGLAQEWELDLSVYSSPDTVKTLTMKTSMYGSDMYDPAVIDGSDTITVDVGAPPPPPTGFYAFFPLDDPGTPLTQLLTDARSSTEDTIVWTISWGGTMYPDTVTVDWAGASMPAHGSLMAGTATMGSDVNWSTAIDMSSETSIQASSWMEWVQIRFVIEDTSDVTPPHFANWVPEDGEVDIPTSTTNFSVDVLDDGEVDEGTIDITVFGMSIPSMFMTTTPITGGYQVEVDISTLGVELPACSTITWVASADDMAGNTGTDTASFTTECEDTTYCIDGTVTLEGTSDYSGSIVLAGAYHDTTDASGNYEICGVPAGTLQVIAYHEGYMSDTTDVFLANDTTINFELDLLTGSISGTVTLDGMTDHSGAVVEDWVSGIQDTTNSLGEYSLEEVPLGTVELHATYTGYSPSIQTFDLTGDTTGVDFYLFEVTDSYDVSGTVTLEGESDYSGVKVLMTGVAFAESVTTGSSGEFSFTVEGGTYGLTASKTGFESYEDTDLMVDDDLVLSITLDTLEAPTEYYNPPANLQATSRPVWPGQFNLVTWYPPMNGDTTMLAHCSSAGWGDTHYGGFSIYYGFGSPGGGYAMPFVAPEAGMSLSKVRLKVHPYSYGVTTEINVWEEADTGGPGANLYSEVVTLTDTVNGFAYIDLPDISVGTDVFYVGWIDQTESPNVVYCLLDYTNPDTLAWTRYTDSTWVWSGDNVDMSDGDFAIECYMTGGSRGSELVNTREILNSTKRHDFEKAMAVNKYKHQPVTLEGPAYTLDETPRPHARPMLDPVSYRLYRSTDPFTDTLAVGVEFLATVADTEVYYLDMDDINGETYYYAMVADYEDGSSDISNLAVGYNRMPPSGNKAMLIDWSGGVLDRPSPGWNWDPSDSLFDMMTDLPEFTEDSIYVTNDMERLYGFSFIDTAGNPIWDFVAISWNPYSAYGNWGPRPRGPEWRRLNEYVRAGGMLFIEGGDAMQILSGDGYTTNQYDSLYQLFNVEFYDGGRYDLDTGNVMTVAGIGPVFTPFEEDYSLGHISDFGLDEFEHSSGSGAVTVLTSQLTTPLPHASNGRGVWYSSLGMGYKTYVQSVYFDGIIDIPVGTVDTIFADMMEAFGLHSNIDEKPIETPNELELYGNVPNPFNAATAIHFNVEEQTNVELTVYDLLGNKVNTLVDNNFKPGAQRIVWNGKDAEGHQVESGVYFYKISTNTGSVTRRMVLLK